jgi:hypothetical protein
VHRVTIWSSKLIACDLTTLRKHGSRPFGVAHDRFYAVALSSIRCPLYRDRGGDTMMAFGFEGDTVWTFVDVRSSGSTPTGVPSGPPTGVALVTMVLCYLNRSSGLRDCTP